MNKYKIRMNYSMIAGSVLSICILHQYTAIAEEKDLVYGELVQKESGSENTMHRRLKGGYGF